MKRGFTLIEFLAVIILITLITLLVVPKLLNLQIGSKDKSDKLMEDMVYKATEIYISDNDFYEKESSSKYCVSVKQLVDSESLKKPKLNDKDIINTKSVQITYNKGFKYKLVNKEDCVEEIAKKVYANGDAVYFNVTTGKQCTDYTESQSVTGTKTGCMKFYAFNDEEGKDTLNLILDHNTTAKIAWNSSRSSAVGPSTTFLNQLKTDTDGWQGTIAPANYTMNQTGQKSNANYTIDYSTYKARLIEANEIAKITGYDGWDEKIATSRYYFDSLTTTPSSTCKEGNTSGCQYGWLFDYTNGCTTYGCKVADSSTNGYWTASSYPSGTNYAWIVNCGGRVNNYNVDNTSYYGVRPVITVSKDKLN